MLPLAAIAKLSLLLALPATHAVAVCGVDVPHAKVSPASRALDSSDWPEAFPYTAKDLTPMMAGNDGFFYFLPKFVQHAGEECRDSLTRFYEAVLPASGEGDVLDLCSSWTSHYPSGWRPSPPRRCVALGLNPLELLANPSKTEWRAGPQQGPAATVRRRRLRPGHKLAVGRLHDAASPDSVSRQSTATSPHNEWRTRPRRQRISSHTTASV